VPALQAQACTTGLGTGRNHWPATGCGPRRSSSTCTSRSLEQGRAEVSRTIPALPDRRIGRGNSRTGSCRGCKRWAGLCTSRSSGHVRMRADDGVRAASIRRRAMACCSGSGSASSSLPSGGRDHQVGLLPGDSDVADYVLFHQPGRAGLFCFAAKLRGLKLLKSEKGHARPRWPSEPGFVRYAARLAAPPPKNGRPASPSAVSSSAKAGFAPVAGVVIGPGTGEKFFLSSGSALSSAFEGAKACRPRGPRA